MFHWNRDVTTRDDPLYVNPDFYQPHQEGREISRLYGTETFALQLADGQSWDFCFTQGLEDWGKTFGSIMRLKRTKANHNQRLIFVAAPQPSDSLTQAVHEIERSAMPGPENQSWRVHNPGPIRIWRADGASDKVIELFYFSSSELQAISMSFSLIPVYRAVISNGGLPFHTALVARNGVGVLLAARGDGGKSTCAARIPRPWKALCDDEVVIVRDKNGRYAVHPLPTWSDYMRGRSRRTWDVQCYVPLQATFFLEQSVEDKVVEISKTQAAARAYKSAEQISAQSWRGLELVEARALRQKLFENACALVNSIPAFVLRTSLEGKFWEEIEKVLPAKQAKSTALEEHSA